VRAVVVRDGGLAVEEVADPVPARGQLLLDVLACGICGSDLHARHHADAAADDAALAGYDTFMRSDQAVVMGHEYAGRVADRGPRTSGPKPGTVVVAMPMLRAGAAGDRSVDLVGLSARAPGGYAEQVRTQASLTFAVPNGLAPATAALTEPMAVALHAVRRGEVSSRQPAVVLGCGPIGLGVIAVLKATGVRHVVASDPSPERRALASAMGADVVVDPGESSPYAATGRRPLDAAGLFRLAVESMDKLRAVPLVPWQAAFRAAEAAGATPSGPVVFECVGVPGMLDSVLAGAPLYARVVVVGVCLEPDTIRPSLAVNKELDLRFAFGYTPAEFHRALRLLADGDLDPAPMVTGTVGLDGVAAAFDLLGSAPTHAKVLVDPRSDATL